MRLFYPFKLKELAISSLLVIATSSPMATFAANQAIQPTVDEWLLTLKNAYFGRDYENPNFKDSGSWSQAASLFYHSKMRDTPLQIADKPITVGLDASVQYAVRLSNDKHVLDTALPFDQKTHSQAADFLKHGITLKLGYDKTLVKVGELWLDLPNTSADLSHQLLASYWGENLHSQLTDHLGLEVGRVDKVSPRSQEGFHNFSYTMNGVTKYSDGLNYIDLRYQFSPSLKGEYYYGNLEKLFNKHYVGLEHIWKQQDFSLQSKLKYFNAKNDGHTFDIDAQNIGLLETLKVKNQTFGLGYQEITGKSAYPIPDGYMPESYFIDWVTAGFFKKEERSYHFIYGYDFKDYIPGFNVKVKYVYGNHFKAANGSKNLESESDVLLTYAFQQPYLKGLSLRYLRVDYNVKSGKDFGEDRIFLNYSKKF